MSLSIPAGIVAAIAANADLVALVGDRVWATMAPQGTDADGVPTGVTADQVWVVFHRISGQRESAHDGDGKLEHPRYQFDICGTDKELVDAARDIFCREFDAVNFRYVVGASEIYYLLFLHGDDHEDFDEGNNRIYKAIVDKFIWTETQPSTT